MKPLPDPGRTSMVLLSPAVAVGIALFLLALAVRLLPAWMLQAVVADVATYRDMAGTVIREDNIYARRIFFPYPPYSQFIPAWSMHLAQGTGWSFDFAMKLPAVVADGLTTALIFSHLLWRGTPLLGAAAWSLGWALNPVPILVSAFHGNLMALIPCLTLGAFVSAERADKSINRDLLLVVAALLLGLAIAMRTFPVLLVPIFWVLFTKTWKEVIVFGVLAALPGGLSSAPYFFLARESFLAEVLSYSGFPDFGWVSVLRAIPLLQAGVKHGPFASELVEVTKRLFLVSAVLLVFILPFFRREGLARAVMLPPLLFYGLYGGVSAQYLIWALPFGLVLRHAFALPYSVVASVALVTFYALYHPGILSGRHPLPISPDGQVAALYAASNALLVVLCLAWIAWIVVGELRAFQAQRWSTAAAWLQPFQPWWSSRLYVGALGGLCALWLAQLAQAVGQAQEIVRSLWR